MPKIHTRKRTLVSHPMAFFSIVGFWAIYNLFVTLRAIVLDLPSQGELAMRRVIVSVIGIGMTWLFYLVLRLFDRRQIGERVVAAFIVAMPCALAIAAANFYAFNIYDPFSILTDGARQVRDLRAELGVTFWQEIADLALTNYFFIIAWASLYIAIGYAREVRDAERTAARFARAAHDAEMRSLRYQVNPHFLFNTLNSLSSLVISNRNEAAESMIQNLAGFYRSSLSNDPLEEVALEEEIAAQKRYLEIEAVRYPERLRTAIDLPDALRDVRVPAMILQPLVENAIKYGVAKTRRPVTIAIAATRVGQAVEISVSDDGEDETSGETHSIGIGLANVRDRIEARFGSRGSFNAGPVPSGGFKATIRIEDGGKA